MATQPAQTQVCPETEKDISEALRLLDEVVGYARANARADTDLTSAWGAHARNCQRVRDALAALPLLPSGQAVLCACSDACAKDSEIERLRTAMQEACDLLAERKYGHSARSPGHNARLCLQSALKPLPTPPSIEKSGGEK